jgi:hypothetical protein
MSAKIEYFFLTVMSIVGFLSKHDTLFIISVIAQILFIIKNLPGACKNIKDYKNKIYARMVKKTDKV